MAQLLRLEELLRPISQESPCGENLEYDPATIALEALARGKSEQQFGDTVIPGEEPDWREVREAALALLHRTADIRIAVLLARALLRTDGLPGFAEVLAVLRQWLEERWEHVHPRLDPEDGDPTMRVNALAALAHPETTLAALRQAPLATGRTAGSFSLRDCLMAAGEIPVPDGRTPPDAAAVAAAFAETPAAELQATAQAVEASLAALAAIEAGLAQRLEPGRTPDLSALTQALHAAQRIIAAHVAPRPAGDGAAGAEAAPPGAAVAAPGEIRSREDIVRLLDTAAAYLRQHEPSSPVPHLLDRAKRLIAMDFVALLKELAPAGLPEFETLSGLRGKGEQAH